MPAEKPNQAKKVIEQVFRKQETVYGLKEFEDIKIEEVLRITEEERGALLC